MVCELPPGTRVAVAGEAEASSRRRLRLSKPCQGWVTGKYVERAKEAWSPEGNASFFVDDKAQLTKKTPMGRQLDLFAGDSSVDKSFGSPAMMATDKVEMSLWMVRSLKRFNAALGEEAQVRLLGRPGGQQQESGPQQQQQQQQSPQLESRSGPSSPNGARTAQPKKRLQVLYLAGVEGTGHHGFMPLLLHPAVQAYGNGVLVWWRSLREVLLKTPPAERKAKLRILLEGMRKSSKEEPRMIFEWCSYPFGEEHRDRWAAGCEDPTALAREEASGNPGNSVDLREFVELFSEYADVKVLVLHRGTVSAAWSHKEWDQGLLQHARVIALFSEYLTRVLRDLPRDMWRWVEYEDVCAAHRQGAHGEVAEALSGFLGLPAEALERSFACFRPSTKDAAAEMPADSLREIRSIEERRHGHWFTSLFPAQQLLAGAAKRPTPAAAPSRPPAAPAPAPALDPAAQQSLVKLLGQLNEEQRQAWLDVQKAATTSEAERAAAGKRLQSLLTEDQLFLLRKGLIMQQSADVASNAAIDPSSFTCVHMWLGGCGFGSEVNNLISAAIFCDKHGLCCVVEDEGWNSGRLHEYLQAEPLILRKCPRAGTCRMLDVKRDKRVATKGWFTVCKHAKGVSFQEKTQYARKIWRYTPDVERSIKELNSELALPGVYVAVQIRRGDKVAGSRRETLKVTTADYARAAAAACAEGSAPAAPSKPRCRAVAVCTDDLEAAEELAEELRRTRPELSVHFRSRRGVPPQLRRGHWQAEWNALQAADRRAMTVEFLADVEVMRGARVLVCTHTSNVGRLAALLRDGPTVSLDGEWTND